MLSSVLHSKQATQVNIAIMDTFARLRQLLSSHAELTRKLNALGKKYDAQFKVVFEAFVNSWHRRQKSNGASAVRQRRRFTVPRNL